MSAATAVSMGASVEDSVSRGGAAGAHTRAFGLRGRVRTLHTSLSSGGAVPSRPSQRAGRVGRREWVEVTGSESVTSRRNVE